MKIKKIIFILGLACSFILFGCVLSVNPVLKESDAVFDPQLIGSWEEISGTDRANITRGTANNYEIEYTSEGKTGKFEARLGKLGEHLILDVWAAPRKGELPDPYADILLSGHLQFFLEIGANEVALTTLDPDSLLKALKSKQVQLSYRQTTDEFILTGTTEELRKGLGTYLTIPNALPKREKWQRAKHSTTKPNQPVEVPCFEAAAWREADRLFRRDPHWVGADVASSVDLGNNKTLWLFGDTWIDPTGKGTRKGGYMVSNSIAIQVGRDPSTAAISFYWGRDANGKPDAMFPDRNGESLWFGNGIRVGDRLVLFFARTIRGNGMFGFEHVGWTAIMVNNPEDVPGKWQVRQLPTPTNPLGVLVGFAAIQNIDGYVVALGSQNPVKSHPIFAVRWPAEEVRQGNLFHPEWWGGNKLGWIPDSSEAQRYPLFNGGRTELSIHFDNVTQRFLAAQTAAFEGDIMMRAAPLLTGPWSDSRMLYRPSENYWPNIFIYAGKAHPELTGADLILTYVTNTYDAEAMVMDSLVYYPRFVRLMRCR